MPHDLFRGPRGHFLPGNSYGTGKGVRDRLSRAFLDDMLAAWEEHGRDAIRRVRAEKPERFLLLVAQLVPKTAVAEVDPYEEMSEDELRAALAEALTEFAETGGALIASLPARTRQLLDLEPTDRRIS